MTSIDRNGYNSNVCRDELSHPVLMHDQSALFAARLHLRQPALAAHRSRWRRFGRSSPTVPVEKNVQVVVSNATAQNSASTSILRLGVMAQMAASANRFWLRGCALALVNLKLELELELELERADLKIAAWPAKCAYNFWRSIDATHLADWDGNLPTGNVPRSNRLLPTPNHSDSGSGSRIAKCSRFSRAAQIIALLSDRSWFTFRSTRSTSGAMGLLGMTRTHRSSRHAAQAGISRSAASTAHRRRIHTSSA